MKTKLLFSISALLAVVTSSCALNGCTTSDDPFPSPDGSDLVGAFAEAAWDAAAPHFEGLSAFGGDPFREEEYPFEGDPEAADGFLGFVSWEGDPAARYPEGEPCPELDDIVIHGGIHQKIKVPPEASFAPSMGFIGHEVDCLMLVVTGMYGSTWYQSYEGTLYKTDYAVLLLMSDGSSLFAGLEWESGYITSLYRYDGHPIDYLLNKTRMAYSASRIQSAVGWVNNYDLIDIAVDFTPSEDLSSIGRVAFCALWAEEGKTGKLVVENEEMEILGGLSEAVFEERIPVESLREEYGPEWERELRPEEEASAS